MPIAPGKHPAREILQAFGRGELDDASTTRVSLHLETCVDCKRQVGELSGDNLLDKLRQAKAPAGTRFPGDTPGPQDSAKQLQPANVPPSAVPPELQNSTQYEIIRELGAGGMGVVYLAKNKLMDRLEVLKVISTTMVQKAGALDRFLREIRAAAALSHDNVVKAYSALQFGDLLVFAMEYVEGDDLSKVVKTQGPLAIANASYYARQVALGLQAAHEKSMVHRDIKPHNLILARVGKKHIVKILDFGLAKATSEKSVDHGLTGEGKMLGTPDYMAPEQILDAASADIRADIYSLGCTMYFLLTGSPPFDAGSLFELLQAHQTKDATPLNVVRPEVPVELAAIVAKMMAKEPRKRFQKPLEIAQALTPFFMKPGAKEAGGPLVISVPESVAAESPRPEAVARRSETIAPIRRETLIPPAKPIGEPYLLAPEPMTQRSKPKKVRAKAQQRVKPLHLAWVAMALVLLGLLLWGTGVFRVKTKDGTIVLENLSVEKGNSSDTVSEFRKIEIKELTPQPSGEQALPALSKHLELDLGGVKLKMVRIDPGTFMMGSPKTEAGRKDGEDLHEVEITQPFFMGIHEVTRGQFRAFVDAEKYQTDAEKEAKGGPDLEPDTKKKPKKKDTGHWRNTGFEQTDEHPVVNVTWDDAVAFCAWLSRKEGRTVDLPTEAEWEYACRAGKSTRFFSGDTNASMEGHGNVRDRSFKKISPNAATFDFDDGYAYTAPVGRFKANNWELHDMHGNVWEWCKDWYQSDYYKNGVRMNPQGPKEGTRRVLRGGSWSNLPPYGRAASRIIPSPRPRGNNIGFRVVVRLSPEILPTKAMEPASTDKAVTVKENSPSQPAKTPLASSAADISRAPAAPFRWPAAQLAAGQIAAPDLNGCKLIRDADFASSKPKTDKAGTWGNIVANLAKLNVRDFACEMVGRQTGEGRSEWGVNFTKPDAGDDDHRGIVIRLKRSRGLDVFRTETVVPGGKGNKRYCIIESHPSIHDLSDWNRLLCIFRGRRLEIYINDRAVTDPIDVDEDVARSVVWYWRWTPGKTVGDRVEIQRLRIWDIQSLPALEERARK